MKVISYTALLYGLEYLEYAIRSVIDHVDEHHVIYSPIGAHGHRTDKLCPDSREDLLAAAKRGAGDKLRWHDAGPFAHEGLQRDSIHQYAPDADLILVVDYDEVWHPLTVTGAIHAAAMNPQYSGWRVSMIHYWRSFYRCVLHDPAFPVRVINPRATDNREHHVVPGMPINHLGYAIRPELCQYKWLIHGHLGEYRRDCDWFKDKYLANAQTDTHPVGSDYWNPESVDPADYMPSFMSEHPYWNREVIE